MVMTFSSDIPNRLSTMNVRVLPTDRGLPLGQTRAVVKAAQRTQRDFQHTWFLREWAELAGFTQADAQRELGWSKAKASDVWNGQQYNQSLIDELAPVLKARPFELLLHPDEAHLYRRLRDGAPRLVASKPETKPAATRTGTRD